MKICILIPVYNEAETIGSLVRDLRARRFEVLVVDDGSSDHSGDIARKEGAVVLCHDRKMGKGVSLQKGFGCVLEGHYDVVIAMDGDGQHAVSDVEKFIRKAKEFPGSVINGNRMDNPGEMPRVRFWTNRLMSSFISFICKQKIPDTQCGFRLISRNVLKELKLTSCDFEIETEVLIKTSRRGFRIHSVPILTIYRNESSYINPFLDTIRFLKYIFKEAWTSKS